MTRKDDKGDQPSDGETTWTNTGATRYGRGQHKTGSFGDDMLRPSPNHGTQQLPNDDDDDYYYIIKWWLPCKRHITCLNVSVAYVINHVLLCVMHIYLSTKRSSSSSIENTTSSINFLLFLAPFLHSSLPNRDKQ